MAKKSVPRKGSLQFWPRKRAARFLPRVNWDAINSGKNLKGFIGYKVGMFSGYVKDETADSMTKGKKIIIPVTILECPPLKILSVRFYKNGRVNSEVLSENLDKELKRKVKLPKNKSKSVDSVKNEDYDDVKVICYSQVKKTNIKKTPDILEIGLSGSKEDKIKFIKEKLGKDITISDVFEKGQLADLRGLTKGFGFSGPVKRFGIRLRQHKSEKGVRRPGSIAPWHPARTTFKAPMAGQVGLFTRAIYNNKIIGIENAENKKDILKNIKNYGDIKSDYIIIRGSIQGPAKRQVVITSPLRVTRKQLKKNYELVELR
ncbi:MAG: 50S ribosomal protein L3 [Nanoarchaeota archaeon]